MEERPPIRSSEYTRSHHGKWIKVDPSSMWVHFQRKISFISSPFIYCPQFIKGSKPTLILPDHNYPSTFSMDPRWLKSPSIPVHPAYDRCIRPPIQLTFPTFHIRHPKSAFIHLLRGSIFNVNPLSPFIFNRWKWGYDEMNKTLFSKYQRSKYDEMDNTWILRWKRISVWKVK